MANVLPSVAEGSMDDPAKMVITRLRALQSDRANWDREWQDIVDLVRPQSSDFTGTGTAGEARSRLIYDGTAMLALERLASGLHSHLTNPTDRWFNLKLDPQEDPEITEDHATQLWLDLVSEIIYQEYARERVALNSSLHECYMDIGAFGTCILNQGYNRRDQRLVFRAFPLANCYIQEGEDGEVDAIFHVLTLTARQFEQTYGRGDNHELEEHLKAGRDVTVVHAVFPRTDRDAKKLNRRNMPWASVHVVPQFGKTLKVGGFRRFPFHVARWTKMTGEVYGRSPAKTCLPDIRMLNKLEQIILKASEKVISPPLIVPSEGFLVPLKTHPDALNFMEPGFGGDGRNPVFPLETRANIPIGLEISNQKRDHVRKCFHSDWLEMEKENIEMTAFEVQDRRDEKLRFLSPSISRLQSELLGPLLATSYDLLWEHGRIPAPPPALQGRRLAIEYVSPAAMAQKGMKAVALARWIQDLAVVAQTDPSVYDAVDLDAYAKYLAETRGVPAKVVRNSRELQQIREARQQQEAAQAAVEAAGPVSKAVKDISEANRAGNVF